ncbi:hypothetical protein KC851_02665 [Candidatus Kaiserbacteria bacterium]|nr:hypothetical protein [Candidatus Kaiserbacteria bacterium]
MMQRESALERQEGEEGKETMLQPDVVDGLQRGYAKIVKERKRQLERNKKDKSNSEKEELKINNQDMSEKFPTQSNQEKNNDNEIEENDTEYSQEILERKSKIDEINTLVREGKMDTTEADAKVLTLEGQIYEYEREQRDAEIKRETEKLNKLKKEKINALKQEVDHINDKERNFTIHHDENENLVLDKESEIRRLEREIGGDSVSTEGGEVGDQEETAESVEGESEVETADTIPKGHRVATVEQATETVEGVRNREYIAAKSDFKQAKREYLEAITKESKGTKKMFGFRRDREAEEALSQASILARDKYKEAFGQLREAQLNSGAYQQIEAKIGEGAMELAIGDRYVWDVVQKRIEIQSSQLPESAQKLKRRLVEKLREHPNVVKGVGIFALGVSVGAKLMNPLGAGVVMGVNWLGGKMVKRVESEHQEQKIDIAKQIKANVAAFEELEELYLESASNIKSAESAKRLATLTAVLTMAGPQIVESASEYIDSLNLGSVEVDLSPSPIPEAVSPDGGAWAPPDNVPMDGVDLPSDGPVETGDPVSSQSNTQVIGDDRWSQSNLDLNNDKTVYNLDPDAPTFTADNIKEMSEAPKVFDTSTEGWDLSQGPDEIGAVESTPSAQTAVSAESLANIETTHEVQRGDTLSETLLNNLRERLDAGELKLPEGVDRNGLAAKMYQTFPEFTSAQDVAPRLTPEQWVQLGVGSGDPNLIYPGETIDMQSLVELMEGTQLDGVSPDASTAVDTTGVVEATGFEGAEANSNTPVTAAGVEGEVVTEGYPRGVIMPDGSEQIVNSPEEFEAAREAGAVWSGTGEASVAGAQTEGVASEYNLAGYQMSEQYQDQSYEFLRLVNEQGEPVKVYDHIINFINRGVEEGKMSLPDDMSIGFRDYNDNLEGYIAERLPDLGEGVMIGHTDALTSDEWQRLGIASGDPRILSVNDTLPLGKLVEFIFTGNKEVLFSNV